MAGNIEIQKQIEAKILELLAVRGESKTICPSEVQCLAHLGRAIACGFLFKCDESRRRLTEWTRLCERSIHLYQEDGALR